MDNKFNPIDHNFVNRNFNDRRIMDKMGVPQSPEKGGDYGYRPKPKAGPHDPKPGNGYEKPEKGWGGVKSKPKSPKPMLPSAAATPPSRLKIK